MEIKPEENTKEELPVIEFEAPVVEDKNIPRGRPSLYSVELAHEICSRMAKGESLRNICRDEHMPAHNTVVSWALDDYEGFYDQYARAREIQAENMFDEILDIADDGSNDYMTVVKGNQAYEMENKEVTNRSRLRVDSRKWYLSKVLPKKFGDKTDLTSGGEPLKGNAIIIGDFKDATDNK